MTRWTFLNLLTTVNSYLLSILTFGPALFYLTLYNCIQETLAVDTSAWTSNKNRGCHFGLVCMDARAKTRVAAYDLLTFRRW